MLFQEPSFPPIGLKPWHTTKRWKKGLNRDIVAQYTYTVIYDGHYTQKYKHFEVLLDLSCKIPRVSCKSLSLLSQTPNSFSQCSLAVTEKAMCREHQ